MNKLFVELRQSSANNNEFHCRLKQDLKNITQSNTVYVPADKTSNMYQMQKEQYDQHLTNAITKTYKKANETVKNKVIGW